MPKYLRLIHALLISLIITLTFTGTVVWAGGDYVEGEIIVRYKDHVSRSEVLRSINSKGAERIGGSTRRNTHFIKLPEGTTVEEGIEEFQKDPDVLYAEPNYIVHALAPNRKVPNDPKFSSEQWGLDNTDPNPDIDAPEAWYLQTGSSGTIIAVIDTGMDMNHEDLVAQLWTNTVEIASNNIDDDGNGYIDDINGWDFDSGDADPTDGNSHGTHISGIIGAETNTGTATGVAGINWNVKIMVLKAMDDNRSGLVTNITSAVDYAVANGANIINASFGFSDFNQELYSAIEDAKTSGVLFIAAAGNNSAEGVDYPALYNLDNIISVTATDSSDALAELLTNTFGATGVEDVDLGAPGLNIFSTNISNAYGNLSGTSQAAAFVTGVAGLLFSEDTTLTPDQIKALVLRSVDTVSDTSITNSTASGGRLNAYNSLDALQKINMGTATENEAVIVPFTTGLNVGKTRQFTLFGDTASSWKSTNESVGTIDSSGVFTAVAAGTCKITVDGTGSNTYTTATIYVKDISVTATTTSLKEGEQVTFSASGGTSPYTWVSNNTSVISVNSSGLVTALKKGSATITVTDAKGYLETSATINVKGTSKTGNCFIATAAFGSPMEPHVHTLQNFRDRYLLTNAPGRAFVDFYYQYSPPIADWIAERPLLRAIVRTLLIPLVLFGSFMMKTGLSWKGLFICIGLITMGTVLIFLNYTAIKTLLKRMSLRVINL